MENSYAEMKKYWMDNAALSEGLIRWMDTGSIGVMLTLEKTARMSKMVGLLNLVLEVSKRIYFHILE